MNKISWFVVVVVAILAGLFGFVSGYAFPKADVVEAAPAVEKVVVVKTVVVEKPVDRLRLVNDTVVYVRNFCATWASPTPEVVVVVTSTPAPAGNPDPQETPEVIVPVEPTVTAIVTKTPVTTVTPVPSSTPVPTEKVKGNNGVGNGVDPQPKGLVDKPENWNDVPNVPEGCKAVPGSPCNKGGNK